MTAVNFDIRGFDTLGEEYIMFASVLGVMLLLRRQPDERDGPPIDKQKGRRIPTASDAVRILTISLTGPVVLFGIYIVGPRTNLAGRRISGRRDPGDCAPHDLSLR